MTELRPGLCAEIDLTVTEDDTARALRSGDVDLLATPRLLALVEEATVAAIAGALEPGRTSLGTQVEMKHVAATPVGATVTVRAELASVDGRSLRFEAVARDEAGSILAHAWITRVSVDRDRFLSRFTRP